VRFAVIGDAGTGGLAQVEVAKTLAAFREPFAFTFVLMLGDNLYGEETPRDYALKFERPYRALLDAGVAFHAVLGNHDQPSQRYYRHFNMNGKRYYSFTPEGSKDVRFFALDSNYLDRGQIEWLEDELAKAGERWKICFFHHPLYSSGRRHGPNLELREALEPLFERHGVDVVFQGHEHFYERIEPQKGIHYFISGAAGKLRRSNLREDGPTAKGFDRDYSFMLVEIGAGGLHFQTVARNGATVDKGTLSGRGEPVAEPAR
jgi:predicted phosphodiesterase